MSNYWLFAIYSIIQFNFIIISHSESPQMVHIEQKSHPIAVSGIKKYTEIMEKSGGFKEEFESVPTGQAMPWDYARSPEHKDKNRYKATFPYDHTRVILTPINNDSTTDYINADYVDGYNVPQRYIATQAPLTNTFNDFWRMIWQMKVHQIAMLTKDIVSGNITSPFYWSETSETYGDIKVTLKKRKDFDDYVIRTFQLEKDGETRNVTHYHYISWPDMGVPKDPTSILRFIDEIHKSQYYNSPEPIVIHCMGGVGRTGTFILINTMLDMAKKEPNVDLLKQFTTQRMQRVDMIEKLEQYVFAHETLVAALNS